MGLFHGNKPLCPNVSHVLKGSSDESGIYEVEKVLKSKIAKLILNLEFISIQHFESHLLIDSSVQP